MAYNHKCSVYISYSTHKNLVYSFLGHVYSHHTHHQAVTNGQCDITATFSMNM